MERIELEQRITSQILQKPELLARLTVPLDAFTDWEMIEIIKAVEQMEKDGVRVTRAEISRVVDRVDRARVTDIWNLSRETVNFKHHVEALSDMIKTEKLKNLTMIVRESIDEMEKPDRTISRIEEYLHTLSKLSVIYEPVKIGDGLKESIDRLEERIKAPRMPGITTGYHHLNENIGGFQDGLLYYLGARPSHGKTALMLNFALHAIDSGHNAGIYSIESNIRELTDRLIAIDAGVDTIKIRNGSIAPSEHSRIEKTVHKLYDKMSMIYHNPHSRFSDIAIQARRMVRNQKIDILFVDYLGLIKPPDKLMKAPRHMQVADSCRDFKALASDLDIPVVVLVQINRAGDEKPKLKDFAESSAIEATADVAMGIYHEYREVGEYSAIDVLKARDGIVGECAVNFYREYLRFYEETKV